MSSSNKPAPPSRPSRRSARTPIRRASSPCIARASKAADLADWLLAQGAERVTVAAVEQVFDKRNPLHDALISRIGDGC